MAKNNQNSGRTMAVVLDEIKTNIDKYNSSKKSEERNALSVSLDALIKEYNEMSLLTAYAGFMDDESPMLAFAKAYTYPMVGKKDTKHREVKNGVMVETVTRVLDDQKRGYLNIKKFLAWVDERGKSIAASSDWMTKMGDARDIICKRKEAEYTGGTPVSNTKLKEALQGMIDALLVIPGEKGGNALVVTGKNAAVCCDLTLKGSNDFLSINVAARQNWERASMALLHLLVEGKEFTVIYGDPESPDDVDASAEEDANTETTEA